KWNGGRRHCLHQHRLNSERPELFLEMVGIPDKGALGAHGVGELDLRTIPDVRLDLLPTSIFGVDFFARSADGQEARQGVEFGDGLLQFSNDALLLSFRLNALSDVAAVDDDAANVGMIQQIVSDDFQRDPGAVGMASAVLDGIPSAGNLPEFA